jgi:hypothetical protein
MGEKEAADRNDIMPCSAITTIAGDSRQARQCDTETERGLSGLLVSAAFWIVET